MKRTFFLGLLTFILETGLCHAQVKTYDQSLQGIASRLKKDVYLLASDSLQGREAGTYGEQMARDYIVAQFKSIGLKPFFFDSTYLQAFDVNGGASPGSNSLSINGIEFYAMDDFYPLNYAANDSASAEIVNVVYGLSAPGLKRNDYANVNMQGSIALISWTLPDSLLEKPLYAKYVDPMIRAQIAAAKGAKAVIFYNPDPDDYRKPPKILSVNVIPLSVPVVFADKKAAKMLRVAQKMKAVMHTEIKRGKDKQVPLAYNIGGYIDNGAKFSVVIGAHYDHLGFKDNAKGKKEVYNGADDNASGTANMIELARYFSDTVKEKYNLIFLAFSAEEKGLYGSEYFVKSNVADLSKIAFMLNCDMNGRLDTAKKELTIYCEGSSPAWDKIIKETDAGGLKILEKKEAESGSDHYNFYRQNIPSLFFFTELHSDYHMPGDDASKVNYYGEAEIVKYIERFFNAVNSDKKLPFSRTAENWY